jgi:hypothetical protein
MARPFKTGVDYFPLDVIMEDEIELIESEHGITGFGVLIKLYQKVYASNYWVKWDKKAEIVFSKRVNVNINEVNAIINSCLEWGIFDKKLFKKYGILTSRGIQNRFFEIIKRRKEVQIVKEYLLIKPNINANINSVNVDKSTQSKGKESKLKQTKELFIKEKAFEKWWSTYPKRNGKRVGKQEALEQFLKLDVSEYNDLKKATDNYSSEDYPKDACRFLKKDYWKDWINVQVQQQETISHPSHREL